MTEEEMFEKRFFTHATSRHVIDQYGSEEEYLTFLLDISKHLKVIGGYYSMIYQENGVYHVYSHFPKQIFSEPVQLVHFLGGQLAASEQVISYALELIKEVVKRRLHVGHRPMTFPASALYIAFILYGEKVTQKRIAKVANIAQRTIQVHYLELVDIFREYLGDFEQWNPKG